MKIVCANTIKNINYEMSCIFVDGFYDWLKFFSKDKEILKKAFAHIFNLDIFYVAIIDEKIAGFAAISDNKTKSISLNKKELRKHLGYFKGYITFKILKHEFEDKQYPFNMNKETKAIEFVATRNEFKRRGIASKIIKYIFENNDNQKFILEVADTNVNAVSLYEKLGFNEFKRIKMKNSKQSGINYLVYMEYDKNKL